MNEKKCIVVLGMHRSGTSALTGVLNILGINLGKNLPPPAEDNIKGFFENPEIVSINEKNLNMLASSWDDLNILPDNWWNNESLSPQKSKFAELITSDFDKDNFFAIKDPRICILLPFWIDLFEKLNIKPYFIIPLRNPLEIAFSLQKRNNFPVEKSLFLWMKYMLSAEFYSRNYSRFFILFEELISNTEKTIHSILNMLDITVPESFKEVIFIINKFLDSDLRHYNIKNEDMKMNLLPSISKFYSILLNLAKKESNNTGIISEIDDLRQYYYEACKNKHSYIYCAIQQDLKAKENSVRTQEEYIKKTVPYYFTRLYIDTGSNFNEEQSITREISGNEFQLEFDLKPYGNICAVCFEPLNTMVKIKLEQIKIISINDTLYSDVLYQTNASYQKDKFLIFDNNNPGIYIDIRDIVNPQRLLIKLEYIALGKDVYKYIVEEKSTRIMECQNEIERLSQWSENLNKENIQKLEKILELEKEFNRFNNLINSLENSLKIKYDELKIRDNEIDAQKIIITGQIHQIQNLLEKEKKLNDIYNSHGWKALTEYYKLRDLILPEGSKRREFIRFLFRSILTPVLII